jgi:hypothetical protein
MEAAAQRDCVWRGGGVAERAYSGAVVSLLKHGGIVLSKYAGFVPPGNALFLVPRQVPLVLRLFYKVEPPE